MSDKRYCGTAKITESRYGGYEVTLLLFDKDVSEITARLAEVGPDKPVRLKIREKRHPKSQWTHYGEIDTWEPGSNGGSRGGGPETRTPNEIAADAGAKTAGSDKMPF
jgi:hypothetical protein